MVHWDSPLCDRLDSLTLVKGTQNGVLPQAGGSTIPLWFYAKQYGVHFPGCVQYSDRLKACMLRIHKQAIVCGFQIPSSQKNCLYICHNVQKDSFILLSLRYLRLCVNHFSLWFTVAVRIALVTLNWEKLKMRMKFYFFSAFLLCLDCMLSCLVMQWCGVTEGIMGRMIMGPDCLPSNRSALCALWETCLCIPSSFQCKNYLCT